MSLLSGAQEGITVRRNRDGFAVWVPIAECRLRIGAGAENIALSTRIGETYVAARNGRVA
jgi:hypothetical protein